MGHQYQAVQWNGNKIVYDIVILMIIAIYLGVFMVTGLKPHPETGNIADPVVLMIRGLGTCAFLLLTFILLIGPLARLSDRFKPFLYNRRHLGVITFFVALAHGGLSLMWYHGGGGLNPLVSVFVSNAPGDAFPGFPFEVLGLIALVILFLMAATSHDFWLNNLSAPVWKALHMLVYPAYALIVLHVALGALLTEKAPIYPPLVIGAFLLVAIAHISTGFREWRSDSSLKKLDQTDWVAVAAPYDIPDGRAVTISLAKGDRVAVFRDGQKISAVTNACKHQNGPLGEGRVVDGCITCPWHGWQYRMEDGVSPPPFVEEIATYNLSIIGGMVMLDPKPNPPGTYVEPVLAGSEI